MNSRLAPTLRRVAFALAFIISSSVAVAQTWKALGPSPALDAPSEGEFIENEETGRLLAIAVHPTDEKTVFIGYAGGGLYRSQDAGKSWTGIELPDPTGALKDLGQTAAVGAIAFAPKDPTTIFVGTGQRSSGGSDAFFGVGLYIIKDALSASPQISGPFGMSDGKDVFTGRSISAILVHPEDSNRILVSTGGAGNAGKNGDSAPKTASGARGLYRCTNALSATPTFEQIEVPAGSSETLIEDMVMEPGNPGAIIVASTGFDDTDAGVFRTEEVWSAPKPIFKHTLKTPKVSKLRLAINKVGDVATLLVATSEKPPGGKVNGVLRRSTDGGKTFEDGRIEAADGFAAANVVVEIDPTNANIFYLGGSARSYGPNVKVITQTVDGGKTFTDRTKEKVSGVHDDSQVFKVAPSKPSVVYAGNDGGIWRSNNEDVDWTKSSPAWTDCNVFGLSGSQLNTIAMHPKIGNFIFSGAQDNGSPFLGPDGKWVEFSGGDGGVAVIDQNATATSDVTLYYCNAQTSSPAKFSRVIFPAAAIADAVSGKISTIELKKQGKETVKTIEVSNDPAAFYNPMVLGPGNPNTLYFGGDRLWRSADKGDTLTLASQGPLVAGQLLSAIAISPQDDQVRVVGLDNGQIFATTSGSSTLTEISVQDGGNVVKNAVGRLAIDPQDKTTAYVAFGGFDLPGKHVWRKTGLDSATPAWTAIGNGIPDVPVNAFVIDPRNSNHLYAGTDLGVWASTDAGANWARYGSGLPRIAVFDMAIQEELGLLRVATYGSGVWEIPLASKANTATMTTSNTSASEGGSNALPENGQTQQPSVFVTFTLTLSQPSTTAVTYHYMTVDGTAKAGSDYEAQEGDITFAVGETVKTIQVKLIDDNNPEPNEDFYLRFTDGTNGYIGSELVKGTIVSEEPQVTVSINDVGVAEENAGTSDEVFTVTLSAPSNQDISVDFTTADDTTEAGNDYAVTSGTLTIAAGDTTGTITVPVKGDTLAEADEKFFVLLSNPTGDAAIAKAQGIGTITNDDAVLPLTTVANANAITINAAGAATPYPTTIDVSGVSGIINKVTVRLNDVSHAYADDIDVLLVGPGGQKVMLMSDAGGSVAIDHATLTFDDAAAKPAPADREITTGTYEPGDNETGDTFPAPAPAGPYGTSLAAFNGTSPNGTWKLFVVDDTNGDGGVIAGGWSLTISTQTVAQPFVSVDDIAVMEGSAGTSGAGFTVKLSAASTQLVQVEFATADGTASDGTDYTGLTGTISFPPGVTSKSVVVPINGSTDPEPDQTFFLNLTAATNAVIADNQAKATIVNDDIIPEINIGDLGEEKLVRVNPDNTGEATFEITLSEPATQEVRVDYATKDGDAKAGVDYVPITGTAIFPPGQTALLLTIPILANSSPDRGATFFVDLSNPVNGEIGEDEGIGQIVRNGDRGPLITEQPQDRMIDEGDPVTFSVSAIGAATLTYQWFHDGSAIGGATGASYTIAHVKPADAGDYTVVVTNSLGLDESDEAVLDVEPRGGMDAVAGLFHGLVSGTEFDHRTTGRIGLRVTRTSRFSGTIVFGGKIFRLKGHFDPNGVADLVAGRRSNRITVHLELDLSPGGGIFGTVSSGGATSDVNAARAENKPPQAGRYTIALPRNPDHPEVATPQGNGYGVVVVDASGNLRFNGRLGDGTAISQGTKLTADGWWSLYARTYRGAGSVSGWVGFYDVPGVSDLTGTLDWFSPSLLRTRYPQGFATEIELVGARYTPPATAEPIIALSGGRDATVALSGGNLELPLTENVEINDRNRVTVLTLADRLSMTITAATGSFHGSFIDPETGSRRSISGVFLRKANLGAGLFLGDSQAGAVDIAPAKP